MQVEGGFRRKLGTACRSCKRRKVRCDIVGNGPCTPCQKISAECSTDGPGRTPTSKQRSRRTLVRHGQMASPHGEASHTQPSSEKPRSVQDCSPSPAAARTEDLNAFYERGIATRHWDVFSNNDPIRVIYVGDGTSSLHQLVLDQDPSIRLHYPFPPIKPQLPWKPTAVDTLPGGYLSSTMAQDLSSFPTREVRDELVRTYFRDIHPGLPVIDEEEFQRLYADTDNPPPLLLFHSVLLAAARISDHAMIAPVRATVTNTLFKRAKTLFEMRHENDRTTLVQAALLLAWHVENADTVSSNAYHWVGLATRTALGLGMHRDLAAGSQSIMPSFDKRLYRRLWWAVLQAETSLALEYGRPPMIRAEDFDQPALGNADFFNINGSEDMLVCKDFVIVNCELSQVALEILRQNAPRAAPRTTVSVDTSLASIVIRLPFSHDFWACQLRINHSLLTLLHHRTISTADSSVMCREAASSILTSFETVLAQGTIRMCSYQCSTALFAAAVQFSREVKANASSGSVMRTVSSHAQLERLLRPLEILSTYWPHVEALHKLCANLHLRCSEFLQSHALQTPSTAEPGFSANADIPWQDIMADFQFNNFEQTFGIEDWMNTI